MKNLILLLFISLSIGGFAQKKSEIIQKSIEVKRYLEQDLEKGEKDPYIVKEEFFNLKGELVEVKDYDNQGRDIKNWVKYKYDNDSQLIEELELDEKEEQKERIEYKYDNGLRTNKLYYDEKNRLSKSKVYEYEIR
jgi:hypothetical protein